jgi:DNA-binding MarR family transcriptional regulator
MRPDPVRQARKRTSAAARGRSRAQPLPPGGVERAALEFRTLQDLRTVVGTARGYDAEVRRATGISGSQLWALSEISSAAGMSVNSLAERLALHQTTASNLVNALVERRLIRRARDDADQRVVRLHATAEGMRLLLRAPRPYTGLLVDALRQLEPGDLARLSRSLAALLGAMRRPAVASAGEMILGE